MKKYLLAGIIILLPLILTITIFVFLVDLFTSPFLNAFITFLTKYEQTLPLLKNPTLITFFARVLIIILLCIFIFLLGIIARWFIFRWILHLTNKILSKIPFIKSIYNALKDIMGSFINQERKAFTNTTMLAFPSKDSYCVGFETGEVPKEIQNKISKNLKPVFMPTAPHPISGYLVFSKEKELLSINITNEEAVKFTVSCGLIIPGEKVKDALEN